MLAIETDPFAVRILKKLYPDVSVINKKFEDVEIGNNSVDLVIGNPPYGGWSVKDRNNPDLAKYAIHHYFASRSIRLLRKNGILAFVINSYFMDNVGEHVRDIIEEEGGSLLVAYRLPETLFRDAKVTVDIVIIVKERLSTRWQKTKPITIGKETKPINEYYIDNPENVLGKLAIVPFTSYQRTGLVCQAEGNLVERLKIKLQELSNNPLPFYV